MPSYIRVINFEKYQHYNKTKIYTNPPPWIKLYTSLLNSYPFCILDDHIRFQGIGILLLASTYNNQIPVNPTLIQEKLRSKQPIDLQALVNADFIEIVVVDNSTILENPRADTEQETEKRLLKDCPVNCVNSGDNFLVKSSVGFGNSWFSLENSKYGWLWTNAQVELFIKGLEDSGYMQKSKKSAELLVDEVAYAVFEGVFKETRPVEKAINAVLKSFNNGVWNTPKGYV